MEYRVESIDGLDWSVKDLVTKKPVLIIGTDAFAVVPLKANVGHITKLVGNDGREIELRLNKIEPIPRIV